MSCGESTASEKESVESRVTIHESRVAPPYSEESVESRVTGRESPRPTPDF